MKYSYSDDLGSDQEAEYSNKIVSLPPTEVAVGAGEIPVTQIACGMHHTGKIRTIVRWARYLDRKSVRLACKRPQVRSPCPADSFMETWS